jgi:threonine/homoserine/homoserine lactone efflux protein
MLNLTPGNDMIYVISRSLSQGFKGGLYSAFGVCIGCFVHIAAAVFGLSIIIAKSSFLFSIIKFVGAGYLIYLGVKALLKSANVPKKRHLQKTNHWKLLKQGIITNALNPKVAIFFLSFLPQFIDTTFHNFQFQLLTLGVWFDLQGTFILIVVAFLVGKSRNFIKQNPKFWNIQEKVTGLILLGLGIRLIFISKK